jgi:isopentenyl diphosphate isomerase/L-lactate dehydrogenase-like FMN-dependent dehydrogenase
VPRQLTNVADYREAARVRLPRMVYDFVSGGAEDEVTLGANEADLRTLRLLPRALVDVAAVDTSVTLFGTRLPSPVLLGPAGLAGLLHADGECEIARGAGRASTIYTLSTGSSRSIEQVAEAASGPLWFQLYLWKDRQVIASLVQRAKAAGYQALCLTVDVPVIGNRERDAHNGMAIPPRLRAANVVDVLRHPRWVSQVLMRSYITYGNLADPATQPAPGLRTTARSLAGMLGRTGGDENAMVRMGEYVDRKLNNPGSTWDDFAWLRRAWDGPLLVKGILSADDARTAVRLGADGVVVSNHGGRQLDTAVSSIAALPRVVDAVGDNGVVLIDGGVRRGSDVAKALALGAQACLIARPYLYGLSVRGADGVEAVVNGYQRELARVLALAGCPVVKDLSREWLWTGGCPPLSDGSRC